MAGQDDDSEFASIAGDFSAEANAARELSDVGGVKVALKICAALKAEVEAIKDAASVHNGGMDAAMQGLREEQAQVCALLQAGGIVRRSYELSH